MARTVTPGMTPPWGSVTVPRMLPVVAPWAAAGRAWRTAAAAATRTTALIIVFMLPPLGMK